MAANDGFFQQRRPPAAFKHGILSRYPRVFAAKAGSVTGGRVVFLDGYAGAGRYDDGSPGSPVLFVQAAKTLAELRSITAIFVEQDPARFASLSAALREVDPDQVVKQVARHGDLGQLLPELLPLAAGSALLVFLDPFGTALDITQLRTTLLTGRDRAPTEVLLHFSTSTIARIGGILRATRGRGRVTIAERKTIALADRFLGGQWWHPEFDAVTGNHEDEQVLITATEAALRVADRFCAGLARQTGHRAVAMPVRPEPRHAPKYVLVLFTRNQHGVWHFADTLGRAGIDWQHAVHDARIRDAADRLAARDEKEPAGLFDLAELASPPEPFDPKAYEREHRAAWETHIATNLYRLLGTHPGFRLVDRIGDVYGQVLGQAWEKHVRAAVKRLHRTGHLADDGTGPDFWQRHLHPVIPHQRPPQPNSATTQADENEQTEAS